MSRHDEDIAMDTSGDDFELFPIIGDDGDWWTCCRCLRGPGECDCEGRP